MHTTKQLNYSTLSSQKTAQMTWHQKASWRELHDSSWPTKKSTTTCFEIMAKFPLHDLRHHRYTPFLPVPPRGQSCCLTHSTTSHSLRAVINAGQICAICYIQAVFQPHTNCSHGRLPKRNCGNVFTHLVCQYCIVSPRTWQTDRLKGCLLVQSCFFQQDTYTL